MNNSEAADLLSRNQSVFRQDSEMLEALDMAIKALEMQKCKGGEKRMQSKIDQTRDIVHLMLEITSKVRYLDNGEDRSSEGRTNTYLSQIMVLLGDISISMARIADSLTAEDLKQEQN